MVRLTFDEVTHKILKPNDWEESMPEPAIQKELERGKSKLIKNFLWRKNSKSEENKRCEEIRFPSPFSLKFIKVFFCLTKDH